MMRDRILFALSILWSVAAAVSLTVFLSIPLFALDIVWEGLTKLADMSWSMLMHNYLVLMAYLLNPFEAHLQMPNFPDSASALKHFSEVKGLFIFVIIVALVLIPVVVRFIKEKTYILYHREIGLALIVPLLLTVFASTVGFDTFFIDFHKILFRDNTWLFNPVTDPIINVLTDNFFMMTFIVFGILYEGFWLLFFIKGRIQNPNN